MAIAVGQHVSVQGTSNATSFTTPAATTAASGSTFLISVAFNPGNFSSVSDSKSNTYVSIQTEVDDNTHGNASWWKYAQNGTGGAGHTATINVAAADLCNVHLTEITGGATTGILDQAPAGINDTTSPFTSNTTGTTTQANELVLAFVQTGGTGATETLTWGNSYTAVDTLNNTNFRTSYVGKLNVTSTGTQQSSVTSSSAAAAISFIATFKEASGSNVSVNLTGQAITSTEGTPTPTVSYGLTGRSIASTLGTITPQVIYGLTGQAITSTQGTPTPTVSYGLTGQTINSTEGTPSPTVSYGLTGQSITSTEGTITASTGGGASRTLVGQTITSTLGAITAQWSASQNLIGQRINSTLGTITATVTTDTFLMPNLVLLNYYEALETLQNLGIYIPLPAYAFAPSSISVQWQKSGYPAGLVIAQSPAAGAGVNPGQNVLLTLSAFPFGSVIDNPPDWRQ